MAQDTRAENKMVMDSLPAKGRRSTVIIFFVALRSLLQKHKYADVAVIDHVAAGTCLTGASECAAIFEKCEKRKAVPEAVLKELSPWIRDISEKVIRGRQYLKLFSRS